MPIRQKREQIAQQVRVPLIDVINSTPVTFPGLLQRKAGYESLDDISYTLAGSQGNDVLILVNGTVIIAETYEEEAPVQIMPPPLPTPVYEGPALTTEILDQGGNAPSE